ncbi:substrate-specific activator of APC-dependent proteolysis [Tieghemiomyces parasiticus]|uniref:Substrate-specific activator of APC-dependent proteolysis n=1 Tax=Tieghemiomyces parasiticus TaxID=78921 RepID=A0A9W8A7K3_9FUNG|nr:substrate-specific activator of APC-dependent proteolysis [Tieghemiomyces parasiticus]
MNPEGPNLFHAGVPQPPGPPSTPRRFGPNAPLEDTSQLAPPTPHSLTPSSTSRKRPAQYTYGDRFVPSRSGRNLLAEFTLAYETPSVKRLRTECYTMDEEQKIANLRYQAALHEELIGSSTPQHRQNHMSKASIGTSPRRPPRVRIGPIIDEPPPSLAYSTPRLLNFRSTPTVQPASPARPTAYHSPHHRVYTQSPVSLRTQRLLDHGGPDRRRRVLDRHPYKVLDAPNIRDDYYLHLLDWSARNVVAVALGPEVYLWKAASEEVGALGEGQGGPTGLIGGPVTGVAWCPLGDRLAIGDELGRLALWDYATHRRAALPPVMTAGLCHADRIGVIAFRDVHSYLTGSRDQAVREFDVRVGPGRIVRQYPGHQQEVCGLACDHVTGHQFVSGGNENRILVWDVRQPDHPLWQWSDHTAAVRALAWHPSEAHVLASGGGTTDKTVRTWNTRTGRLVRTIDTASQVCNVVWSRHTSELLTTHGFSQHHIALWDYPSFQRVATLRGHRSRVLNCALAPDGETVVTAAADETLRFWRVFPKPTITPTSSGILERAIRIR